MSPEVPAGMGPIDRDAFATATYRTKQLAEISARLTGRGAAREPRGPREGGA